MTPCQRILVPLDGSSLAERALPAAITLAQAFSAETPCELHILRVVPPIMVALEPTLYTETIHLGEEESQSYLAAVALDYADSGIPIVPVAKTGSVAESIISYAQEQDIDLIVISSHGRSGISRWVYGSVAEKVLRQSCCATLIIREQVEQTAGKFKKILVCLDGSAVAEKVLDSALSLAQCSQAEIILLRVVEPANLLFDMETADQVQESVNALERGEAEAYLNNLMQNMPQTPGALSAHTLMGPTADTIIDFAQEKQVDLIAISSHGRSGISRWVYGSVAEKVMRGAKCATLILRGKK
jgi:nucleotide-binding universal stress UspA family protein